MDVFRLFYGTSKGRMPEEVTVWLQVGSTLWEAAPRRMRSELWHSVLHRRGTGVEAVALYKKLLTQDVPAETVESIARDVGRTFPNIQRFADEEGQSKLLRVLKAYVAYDPEVGYCQGMNFLAGLLLLYLDTEDHAFGALVVLMKDRGLRELYNQGMSLLQVRLWQLNQLMPRWLSKHLEAHGALPVLFASSWLLTSFVADFPLAFAARIMDVVLADNFQDFMLKVAVTLLLRAQEQLKAHRDLDGVLNYLKVEVPGWPMHILQEVVTDAVGTHWTPPQLEVLRNHSGAETVQQMVDRISMQSADGNRQQSVDVPTSHTTGAIHSQSACDNIKEANSVPEARSIDALSLADEPPLISYGSVSSFGGWCGAPAADKAPLGTLEQPLPNANGLDLSPPCPKPLEHLQAYDTAAAQLAASCNIIDMLDVGGINLQADDVRNAEGAEGGTAMSAASSASHWLATEGSDAQQSCSELTSPVSIDEARTRHFGSQGVSPKAGNPTYFTSLSSRDIESHNLLQGGSASPSNLRSFEASNMRDGKTSSAMKSTLDPALDSLFEASPRAEDSGGDEYGNWTGHGSTGLSTNSKKGLFPPQREGPHVEMSPYVSRVTSFGQLSPGRGVSGSGRASHSRRKDSTEQEGSCVEFQILEKFTTERQGSSHWV